MNENRCDDVDFRLTMNVQKKKEINYREPPYFNLMRANFNHNEHRYGLYICKNPDGENKNNFSPKLINHVQSVKMAKCHKKAEFEYIINQPANQQQKRNENRIHIWH